MEELGIKHPLHRQKLQLALQAQGSEEDDFKGRLDHNWVTRWLDDIGLPQYKSQFDEGRVDGCTLHYMKVDDLLSLKVGSVLHHLSIKRAIQVLRLNFYEPSCLRRRPSIIWWLWDSEEEATGGRQGIHLPHEKEMPKSGSFQKALRIYDDNLDQLEQMEDSEGTVRQIGVFSECINSLTSMLKDDEFFGEISTCSPEVSMGQDHSNV